MAGIRLFNVHREWEDWASMLLGVLIGLSPWLAGVTVDGLVVWNAIVMGALVVGLGALELVSLRRWEEAGEIACGLWLIVSPFIFGYGGAVSYWHYGLGAAVALLAVLELWQDWPLDDEALAHHNH